jgi:hypothetical protein
MVGLPAAQMALRVPRRNLVVSRCQALAIARMHLIKTAVSVNKSAPIFFLAVRSYLTRITFVHNQKQTLRLMGGRLAA